MILYNYECPVHGDFNAWATIADRNEEKMCSVCGSQCKKKQCPTHFKLEAVTGHFPTASDKWERFHIAEGQKESRE